MARRYSPSERWIAQSALPIAGSILACLLTAVAIVGSNANSPWFQSKTTMIPFLVGAGLLIASVVVALGRPERKDISHAEELAALKRIVSVLEQRHKTFTLNVLDTAQLEVNRGILGESSQDITVENFARDRSALALRTTLIAGENGSGKSSLMERLASQVAIEAISSGDRQFPLVLSAQSWNPDLHFSRWIEEELEKRFNVRRRVSNSWLHSACAILFIDDVDDVDEVGVGRVSLLEEIERWQSKASGGRVVLALRASIHADASTAAYPLTIDRIARIGAIQARAAKLALETILAESDVFGDRLSLARRQAQRDFLRSTFNEGHITPLTVRALERGSSHLPSSSDDESRDPEELAWAAELGRADRQVQTEAGWDEALKAYLRIASASKGNLSALASVRATLVHAGLGRTMAAQSQFAKAIELFSDLHSAPRVLRMTRGSTEVLDGDEITVLNLLKSSRPLLQEEVFVRSGLSPSKSSKALNGLIQKGFASTRETGSNRVCFYHSAVGQGARA